MASNAARQIRSASDWWHESRHEAPRMFVDDLSEALDVIVNFPLAAARVPHGRIRTLRRVLLPHAQYYLYYGVDLRLKTVRVIALWHTSRGRKPPLR
jgi:hypothetical protein